MSCTGFLVGELNRGGQEQQLYYLLCKFKEKKKPVALFVWNSESTMSLNDKFASLNIPIFYLGDIQSYKGKIKFVRSKLKTYKVCILQSFTYYLNFPVYLCTLGLPVIGIGCFRSQFNLALQLGGLLKSYISALFPKTIVFNNYTGAEQLKRKLWGLKNKNIVVITNGLDISNFKVYSFPKKFTSVSIGSFTRVKRLDLLVDIIYELKNQGVKIRHLHAGKGFLFNEINEKVHKKGLENEISFIGETDNINELIGQGTVLLHTSESEGTPNVPMEGLASGRPVIAFDSGDVKRFVRDEENGFIVENGNVMDFTLCVKKLYENPELCSRMGESGRKFAKDNFSLEDYYQRTIKLYNSLLAN